jgi:hypothetical protein
MNRIGTLAMFAIAIPATTLASPHWVSPVHCDFTGPYGSLLGAGYSCELAQRFGPVHFSPYEHIEDWTGNQEFVDMLEFNLPPEFENVIHIPKPRTATIARYRLGRSANGADDQVVDIRVVYDNWHWQLHVVEWCAESHEDIREIATFAFEPNGNPGDGYEPVPCS